MTIVLSHTSALAFWRSKQSIVPCRREIKRIEDYPKCINNSGQSSYSVFPKECIPEAAITQRLLSRKTDESNMLSELKQPWTILVQAKELRRKSTYFKCSSSELALPEDSVFYLGKDLAICRPELAFLQVASQLTLTRCIQLGFELCGYYSTDYSCEKGFTQHQPLTTKELCVDYFRKIPEHKGRKKLAQALPHIIDGSASPRETICAMLFSLPCRMGGYGLPKPKLNAKVFLSEQAKRTYKRNYYTCDLFWPDCNVAVEFQSRDAHDQSRVIDADKRAALEMSGISVLELTSNQIWDKPQADAFAKKLAAALEGRRLRGDAIPDYEARKDALRADLLKMRR